MSLVFMDGFDHHGTGHELDKWDGQWENTGNYLAPTFVTGRDGRGKAMRINYSHVQKVLPLADTYIVGLAFKLEESDGGNTGSSSIVAFYGPTNDMFCSVGLNGSTKTLYATSYYEGDYATGTRVLSVDTWYYIECKFKVHPTAGSVEVRIDDVVDMKVEGIDTADLYHFPDGNPIWCITVGGGAGITDNYHHIDDLYVCDTGGGRNNDFLGPCRIDTLFATGAGASTTWTPNSGSNYQCVDDASASFSDYVSTSTLNATDLYTFGDMPFTPEAINGVQLTVFAKRSDATYRKLGVVTRMDGVNYTQNGRWLSVTERCYMQINEVPPNGSGLWTVAAVDNAQFGIQMLG